MKAKKLWGIIAIIAMIGFAFTACPSGNGGDPYPDPDPDPNGDPVVVNIAAIGGVTAPESGGTPATAITHTQMTGTIAWAAAGTPAGTTFAENTVYTATITLTARDGFTLTGLTVTFTVADATSVSREGNVVTAVFPTTGGPQPVTDGTLVIPRPVTDEAPVTAADVSHAQVYITELEWQDSTAAPAGDYFTAETYYTAFITLRARYGFTLEGLGTDFFEVYYSQYISNTEVDLDGYIEVTVTFPATIPPPCPNCGEYEEDFEIVFCLQCYIAGMSLSETNISTTHLYRTHGTVTVRLREDNGGNRYLNVSRTEANVTRGLLLRGISFQAGDEVRVIGDVVNPGGASVEMRFQGESATSFVPDGAFTVLGQGIQSRVPLSAAGPFTVGFAGSGQAAALPTAGNLRILGNVANADTVWNATCIIVARPLAD